MTLDRRHFLACGLAAFASCAPLRAQERKRIAAVDWAAAESLQALGLPPMAVSDTRYFNLRMPRALPAQTQDIGPFWEINLELLDRLGPDVIFVGAPSLFMTPRLAEIARVETVAEVTGEHSYERAAAILRQCARAAGLADTAADAVLADIERRMAPLAARIDRDRPVCVLLPDQGGRRAMIYGRNSVPDAVLTRLGLTNAWQGPINSNGFFQTGLDALMALEDAVFVQIEIPTLSLQTEKALSESALWHRLAPVREKRVVRIAQFYPFGGCLTTLHLAETLTAALAKPGSTP